MKNLTSEKKLLLALIVLGFVCALVLCGIRAGIEAKNNRVCIAMGEADLLRIAQENGLSDAAAAADAIGVCMMERDALCSAGMLVEDGAQFSHLPEFGEYVPNSENTRVFLMEGEYAARYASLGYSDAQPLEDMLYRAVTDRNIRLLYLRLFETPEHTVVTDLEAYRGVVDGLTGRLASHGLTLSQTPSAIGHYTPPAALRYLVAVGVVAAALWLLAAVFPRVGARWLAWLMIVGAAFASAALKLVPALFTWGFSFAAAVVAPCAALRLVLPLTAANFACSGRMAVLLRFLKTLAVGFGAALAGGLAVGALQSGSEWLLAVENFRGVKLSQMLPLMFAAFLALRDVCTPKQLLQGRGAWLIAVLGVAAVLAGIWFFLLRTGNAAAAVSVAEQRFRAWLENILLVRPRTKEFCIGWPCLALVMLSRRRGHKRLALVFCVFMTVAFSSIVNTFCHSRAPLWVSLVRSVLGALAGCGIGLALQCLLYTEKLPENGEKSQ